MQFKRFLIPAAAAIAVLASCATYRIEPRYVEAKPAFAASLEGKTLALEPIEVTLGASRFAVDLRDVTLTVNGQEVVLQKRFLTEAEELGLGRFGVLDVNILKKAKTDAGRLSAYAGELLLSALDGSRDYAVPFFKGLGESNMGQLSNRPVDYDRSARPVKAVFDASARRSTLYSGVSVLPSASAPSPAELRLSAEILLDSEVVQIISNSSTMPADDSGMPAMPGDYFLTMTASVLFHLYDAATDKEIATDKTKSEWALKPHTKKTIRIPARKGDADAYAKYFRSVELEPYAREAVKGAVDSILPLIDSFYVNTYHSIKAEK